MGRQPAGFARSKFKCRGGDATALAEVLALRVQECSERSVRDASGAAVIEPLLANVRGCQIGGTNFAHTVLATAGRPARSRARPCATRGSIKQMLSPVAALAVVPAGAPVAPSTPDLNLVTTHPKSGAEIIGDSVNTCFGAGVSFGTVAAAAAAVGATPVGHVAELGNCWQLRLGSGGGASVAAAVAALAARSDVQFAEPEFVVRKQDSCVPVSVVCTDLNHRLVLGLAQAHNYGEGQGVIVAVLDTGMDATVIANGSPLIPNVVIGSNFVTPSTPPVDDGAIGHGTIVAGILQAAAPGVKLFSSKVLDGNSRGSETLAARGLREAALGGARSSTWALAPRTRACGCCAT